MLWVDFGRTVLYVPEWSQLPSTIGRHSRRSTDREVEVGGGLTASAAPRIFRLPACDPVHQLWCFIRLLDSFPAAFSTGARGHERVVSAGPPLPICRPLAGVLVPSFCRSRSYEVTVTVISVMSSIELHLDDEIALYLTVPPSVGSSDWSVSHQCPSVFINGNLSPASPLH